MRDSEVYRRVAADKNPASTVIFWMAAFFTVFWVLGCRSLGGSEDRWAEISRGMLITGDFFHPFINHENYFDKPLLSYWLISALSYACGFINEWTVRLPSAVSALVSLWALRRLGAKLWDKSTANIASWIMLSSLGFIFWARKADADMENMAAIILAVTWFFERKDKPGFISYMVFYAICFIGAQAKGLAAVVIPVAVIIPLLLRDKTWKKHFRISNFAALAIGALLYLIPFVYAGMTRPDASPGTLSSEISGLLNGDRSSGLYMVFRENIERFFTPFDHKERFYVYFIHLPRIMAPWTLLFVAALATFFIDWKRLDPKKRWLLDAVIIIFLIFTASGSRRWYYILPILPFCSLMTAVFIAEGHHDKLRKTALLITGITILAVAAAMLISPVLWLLAAKMKGFTPPYVLYFSIPIAGIIASIPWFIRKSMPGLLSELTGLPRLFTPYALSIFAIMAFSFVILLNDFDALRTEKSFALELKELSLDVEPSRVCFFIKVSPAVLFYMDRLSDVSVAPNSGAVEKFITATDGFFLTQRKFLEDLPENIAAEMKKNPDIAEKTYPWESKKEISGKFLGIRTTRLR